MSLCVMGVLASGYFKFLSEKVFVCWFCFVPFDMYEWVFTLVEFAYDVFYVFGR